MLTVSPVLKDFPRNNLHGFVEGLALGFQRGMDRLREREAEILDRFGHLGEFARVEVGSKLMARNASRPLDLQHALGRHVSLDPFVDRLIPNSKKISELLNTTGFLNCCLDT